MAVDRKQANLQKLQETDQLQDKTQEAIWRIQKQAAEAEEVGTLTLAELRKQGQQLDEIHSDLEGVSAKLDQSQQLQNRFDSWAGNWFGGKKRAALKEAASEIAARNTEDQGKIKEVWQQQSYDGLARKWRAAGFVLGTNPSVSAPELFDADAVARSPESSAWKIDFSLTGIDEEGWTYADNLTTLNNKGTGESAPKWNHYVRRRKWRHLDRTSGNSALDEVKERNNNRIVTRNPAAAAGSSSSQGDKIGYTPRRQAVPVASGLVSPSMSRGRGGAAADPSQELDADSAMGLQRVKARDAEIDAGVDAIGRQLDSLGNIAGAMKEEVTTQGAKIERVETAMQKASEKQTVVNARQRKLVQSS